MANKAIRHILDENGNIRDIQDVDHDKFITDMSIQTEALWRDKVNGYGNIYSMTRHDLFWLANRHFWVSGAIYSTEGGYPLHASGKTKKDADYYKEGTKVKDLSNNTLGFLFDGSQDSGIERIRENQYAVITIKCANDADPGGTYDGMFLFDYINQANLYIEYYYNSTPSKPSVLRAWANPNHWFGKDHEYYRGWFESKAQPAETSSGNVKSEVFSNDLPYNTSVIQLVIFGKGNSTTYTVDGKAYNTGDYDGTSPTEIELIGFRSPIKQSPMVTKYVDQQLFNRFTWYDTNHGFLFYIDPLTKNVNVNGEDNLTIANQKLKDYISAKVSGLNAKSASSVAWSGVTGRPTALSSFTNDVGYITSYTDTKNTAGATNTSSKIYLIGATSQSANPQTYSQNGAYVGTDGCLYSGGKEVATWDIGNRSFTALADSISDRTTTYFSFGLYKGDTFGNSFRTEAMADDGLDGYAFDIGESGMTLDREVYDRSRDETNYTNLVTFNNTSAEINLPTTLKSLKIGSSNSTVSSVSTSVSSSSSDTDIATSKAVYSFVSNNYILNGSNGKISTLTVTSGGTMPTLKVTSSSYGALYLSGNGGLQMSGWNYGIDAFYIGSVTFSNLGGSVGSELSNYITLPADMYSKHSSSKWHIAFGIIAKNGYANTVIVGSEPLSLGGTTHSYKVWLKRVISAATTSYDVDFVIFHIS